MERLRIKNFLIVEDADFEVGRFNIIIGSQASGKSIIAKLLYFFRICLQIEFEKEVTALKLFEDIFPKYVWKRHPFEIHYQVNEFEISLVYQMELKWEFSDNKITGKTLFIPANRSSFSLIQDNIFTLLRCDAKIDFFIQEFGSYYEQVKKNYRLNRVLNKNELIENLVEGILKGKYIYVSGQDWIKTNNQRIPLSNASSGQQEALPMLMMLSVWADQNKNSKIFIEKPEAHLFPVSQKHLVALFGLIYNQFNNDFVITTHSPYILTAINNAILAHDVITAKGKEAVKTIFNPDFAIKYEDVRAYTIENGKLISILNDETRLIGASVIDSVSDEFETVFNNLLEL